MVEKAMVEDTPKKGQKPSILQEETITETLLLHPNQLDKVKNAIGQELKRKVGQWDHERQGVLTRFVGKRQILNGGRGRVLDTSPYIHMTVRYSAIFARPTIGAKLCK